MKLYRNYTHVPIYKVTLTWWFGSGKKYHRALAKLYPLDEGADYDWTDMAGEFFGVGSDLHLFLADPHNAGNAAHETMHAVHYILDRAGLSLSDETQEVYCYLAEHLMSEWQYVVCHWQALKKDLQQ